MTPQQIKDNAPQGATHYSDIGIDIIYLKESFKYGWKCFCFGQWQPYILEDDEDIKPL